MMYMKKLIFRLQRKVITKVTSLPNHRTGRKSTKPIRSRENAFSCTCCFIYLKCFYRKEGGSHGWEDNRRTLFTIYIKHVNSTEARTSAYKGAIGGRYRSIFYELTVPTQLMTWMMCWRLATPPGVYFPYSFRTVVWVLLLPTRADKCKCYDLRDLRFFVLIRED